VKKGSTSRKRAVQAYVNEQIRAQEVRLIGKEGEQLGVVPIAEALSKAKDAGVDLVEVASVAKPPVCRLMDFSKYRYEKEKQKREGRSHQRGSQLKELRFRPRIEDHDYQTKMKALMRFLDRGNKVKVTLVYRGREMAHQEYGRQLLERIQADAEHRALIEREPVQEGRFIFMTLSPKSDKR
jgi:translation initiation factor IF-3